MVKSLPGVSPKPRFCPNLDSTVRVRGALSHYEVLADPTAWQLAFTRYCYYQYCMVYGIHKRGRVGVVYCALIVQ